MVQLGKLSLECMDAKRQHPCKNRKNRKNGNQCFIRGQHRPFEGFLSNWLGLWDACKFVVCVRFDGVLVVRVRIREIVLVWHWVICWGIGVEFFELRGLGWVEYFTLNVFIVVSWLSLWLGDGVDVLLVSSLKSWTSSR